MRSKHEMPASFQTQISPYNFDTPGQHGMGSIQFLMDPQPTPLIRLPSNSWMTQIVLNTAWLQGAQELLRLC